MPRIAAACAMGMITVLLSLQVGLEAAENGSDRAQYAEALAQFNLGVAHLEQYEAGYTKAIEAFEQALKAFPEWTAARFNLGLACLNRAGQSGGGQLLDRARAEFERVLAEEPKHLPARFCLGLYWQYLGQNEKALPEFEKVAAADPNDPYVLYKQAEVLLALGRTDEATRLLERTIELDPGFVSAMYRLAAQYQRKRKTDQAAPLFERFKKLSALELATKTFTVTSVYGDAGKYSMGLDARSLPLAPKEQTRTRVVFSPEVRSLPAKLNAWKWAGGNVNLPALACDDLDGDGDLDLVIAGSGAKEGAAGDPDSPGATDGRGLVGEAVVWLNDGQGRFTPAARLADQVASVCLGDVNNDGQADAWLGRAGEDWLLINQGKGRFERSTLPEKPDDRLTACARLADLDCDGDLDLLAFRWASGAIPASKAAPAASRLFLNRRDGADAGGAPGPAQGYTDSAGAFGLALPDTPIAAVLYVDLDNDRDLDLVVTPARGKPRLWNNHRAGKGTWLEADATGLDVEGCVGLTAGDVDKDGRQDIVAFSGKKLRLFLNRGGMRFEPDRVNAERLGALGGTSGQWADMDNDGDLDLVVADAHRRDGTRGPALLLNDWPAPQLRDAAQFDPGNLFNAVRTQGEAACLAADFNGDGRCDLLLAEMGEAPRLLENATRGGHYLALELQGTKGRDQKSRSNGSAIGSRVEARSGRVFQSFSVGVPAGAGGMAPRRLHIGLGDRSRLEWLRVLWPDGVMQAEADLTADRLLRLTEDNRKISSCPHLFAWNGRQFEFVSDFGGMGGLGFLVAPGVYAVPDPSEYVPLPRLEPRLGHYELRITEPLEEVVYLDEVQLLAIDHPIGSQVLPNEMMAVSAPPPAFEVFCFERPITAARAVDHRGQEVTEALARVDRNDAGATAPDHRFPGFAEEHFVELDFGDQLGGLGGRRLLFCLNGWVEYGYSSTNYAAAQAGLRLKAPSIAAWRDGRWVELFHEVGYPAGLQHWMTLEVTGKVLPGDRKLRITSNMDLRWDAIFLAPLMDSGTAQGSGGRPAVLPTGIGRPDFASGTRSVPDTLLRVRAVLPKTAELRELGYPREYSPDGRLPNLYDYANLDKFAPWQPMPGAYTRLGDVRELLTRADDCFVIFGPGEEVALQFPATFAAVPAGYTRSFVLKTDSYCKDMDLHTAHGDQVLPLPFHGMSGYPYGPHERYPDTPPTRACRDRYTTRTVAP